eukprot:3303607-Pyramimonas_sp.AAC.1
MDAVFFAPSWSPKRAICLMGAGSFRIQSPPCPGRDSKPTTSQASRVGLPDMIASRFAIRV